MSFDDDMKNRFANQAPIVTNLDQGAGAAASSAGRRTAATRGLAAIAFFAFIGLGALALTSGTDTNSLDVANNPDTNVDQTPIEEDLEENESEEVSEETSDSSEEVSPQVDEEEPVVVEEVDEVDEPVEVEPAEEPDPSEQVIEEPAEDPLVVSTLGDDTVFRIVNVESNDTLNARTGAGTDFDTFWEFNFDDTGVVRTSADSVFIGSSEWIEVFIPIAGNQAWVNSSFLESVSVPNSSPCVFNGSAIASATSFTNTEGSNDSEAAVATSMETFRFGSCIRTVIEFSTGFSPANPVTALPNDITIMGDTFDGVSIINFGSSISAAEDADAHFVEADVSQSTYVSRLEGGDLAGLIYGTSSTINVTFDNTNGQIIIDVADTRAATAGVQPLLEENGVVLTDIFSGPSSITISGLARPFEGVLGVEVLLDENPIDVDWTGAANPGLASRNGVLTTDWTSAWGAFDFTIDVDPSINEFDLVVRMDPSGGAVENPEFVDLILEELLN